MSGTIQPAAAQIFAVLAAESKTAFAGVVADIDKHVLPAMSMIAQNLATIGAQQAAGDISHEVAELEIEMQVRAAASVIVGFANTVLLHVQAIINAVLDAVRGAVNGIIGVALL